MNNSLSNIILKQINQNTDLGYDESRIVTENIIKEFSKQVNQCASIRQIKELLK